MAGQPKSDIDWNIVDQLLVAGCSGREIAGYIGVCPKTIYLRCEIENGMPFSEYSQQKQAKGDSILRSHQYAKALGKTTEGDNTLLIWLGKQRLDQKDNKDNTNNQQKVVFEVNYKNDNDKIEISPQGVSTPDSPSSE